MNTQNPILNVDSYKVNHNLMYPSNVTGMFSYIEARTKNDVIIPFGLQYFLIEYLSKPITMEHIDEAETFYNAHFGFPFNREPWEYIVNQYNGFFPVTIRAVPEGTPTKSNNALVTIECNDAKVFWCVSFIETALLRAIWYPTTIASLDYESKKEIERYYDISGADQGMVPFALTDFGGRGVSSNEQAMLGGAAHLVNFMGSDTVMGVYMMNKYYNHPMSGFSVKASEHSVQCSFGPEHEIDYLRQMISIGAPGQIISVVIDGYDTFKFVEMVCSLKDEIIQSGIKLVLRPDSGEPEEVLPRIFKTLEATFGVTYNQQGFKKINTVGVLWGDGINRQSLKTILGWLVANGWSADQLVLGSGGGLLQNCNRDTFKFTMKASAIKVNGIWVGISKNPITDPGKKSKEGQITTGVINGEQVTYDRAQWYPTTVQDLMVTVYENGLLVNQTTCDEIRSRCV